MCAYRSMPWGMHTARTWRNFQIQTQGKKFARVATACVHTGLCPWVHILRGHGATFKFKLKAKSSRGYAKHAEPNLTGSDGNLRNATLEQISNDMGRCTHETHLLCGRESNAPRRSLVTGAGACAACAGAASALVTAPRRELVLDDFSISGFTTWIWKGQ